MTGDYSKQIETTLELLQNRRRRFLQFRRQHFERVLLLAHRSSRGLERIATTSCCDGMQ